MKRLSDIVKEQLLVVHTLAHYPDVNNSIKMEVGIETVSISSLNTASQSEIPSCFVVLTLLTSVFSIYRYFQFSRKRRHKYICYLCKMYVYFK